MIQLGKDMLMRMVRTEEVNSTCESEVKVSPFACRPSAWTAMPALASALLAEVDISSGEQTFRLGGKTERLAHVSHLKGFLALAGLSRAASERSTTHRTGRTSSHHSMLLPSRAAATFLGRPRCFPMRVLPKPSLEDKFDRALGEKSQQCLPMLLRLSSTSPFRVRG